MEVQLPLCSPPIGECESGGNAGLCHSFHAAGIELGEGRETLREAQHPETNHRAEALLTFSAVVDVAAASETNVEPRSGRLAALDCLQLVEPGRLATIMYQLDLFGRPERIDKG